MSTSSHVLESVGVANLESDVSTLDTINLEARRESISPWMVNLWYDVENEGWLWISATALIANCSSLAFQDTCNYCDICRSNSSKSEDSEEDCVEEIEFSWSNWEGLVSGIHVGSNIDWESVVTASKSCSEEGNESIDQVCSSGSILDKVVGAWDCSVEVWKKSGRSESTEGLSHQESEELDIGEVQGVRVSVADGCSASKISANEWLG